MATGAHCEAVRELALSSKVCYREYREERPSNGETRQGKGQHSMSLLVPLSQAPIVMSAHTVCFGCMYIQTDAHALLPDISHTACRQIECLRLCELSGIAHERTLHTTVVRRLLVCLATNTRQLCISLQLILLTNGPLSFHRSGCGLIHATMTILDILSNILL